MEVTFDPGWEKEVIHELLPSLERLGEEMHTTMDALTPVAPSDASPHDDPGHLRESNEVVVDPETGVITLRNDADYAVPVEYGHVTASGSWVPAQPFMRPTIYRDYGEI